MPDIGNTLREARIRRGLSLADVENVTKIRSKYLEALEENDFEVLPGPTVVRGSFARTPSSSSSTPRSFWTNTASHLRVAAGKRSAAAAHRDVAAEAHPDQRRAQEEASPAHPAWLRRRGRGGHHRHRRHRLAWARRRRTRAARSSARSNLPSTTSEASTTTVTVDVDGDQHVDHHVETTGTSTHVHEHLHHALVSPPPPVRT